MSGTSNIVMNAEMQHEINAVETEQKWRRLCKQWRKDGTIPPNKVCP